MSLFSLKNKALMASVCVLVGCAGSRIDYDVKPKSEPVYNFTQSSKVLACLGHKIDITPNPSIDVYITDIPDHTIPSIESGFLTKNAVMMVTTALDRLGTRKIAVIGKNGALKDRRQVQVLGSFTELNRTVDSQALSAEAVFPAGLELDIGGDKNANHIALDLAMSERNRIIPNTATSVSIQVHGNSGNATLTYDEGEEYAAIGAIGFTGQEGFHSAQRLLIETSVALMMAKYYDVDIRDCLHSNRRENAPEISTEYDEPVFEELPIPEEVVVVAPPVVVGTVPPPVMPVVPPTPAAVASSPVVAPVPQAVMPAVPNVVAAPVVPPLVEPVAIAPPVAAQVYDPYYPRMQPGRLLEQEGLIVLPVRSGPRFLRAQPPEYAAPSNQPYSGVPVRGLQDPAVGVPHDFLDENSPPSVSAAQ